MIGTSIGNSLIWDNGTNVGIGNTNTSYTLDVSGTGRFTSTLLVSGAATFSSSVTAGGDISANAGSSLRLYRPDSSYPSSSWFWNIYMDSSNLLSFAVNGGTPKMIINASGNVCIGATSAINGGQFFAQGASTQAGEFYANTTSGTASLLVEKSSNDSSTSQVYIRFLHNSATSGGGQINGNGASSAAFGSYSDERLKENITDLSNQLSNILALRPVEFDYIESEGGGHQIGFIAQEMEKVYPDVVGKRDDDMLTVTGWSKTEARLVKAIQEQQAQIQNLQEQNQDLKSRLDKAGL